jgi:NitT/TauT family transport system ATP-binding protein
VTTPKIELHHVSKSFHANGSTIKALEDISLQVQLNEFLTIIGPSGSGKSTLFNLIVGLLQPDEGEIYLDGEICIDRIGKLGYMPQRDLLLPWRSVLDNVIIPKEIHRINRNEARLHAQELLPLFGLEELLTPIPVLYPAGCDSAQHS